MPACLPSDHVFESSLRWGFFKMNLGSQVWPSLKWVLEYFLGSKGGHCEIDNITNQVLIGLKIWGKHNVLNMPHCMKWDILAIYLVFILYYTERVMLYVSHFTFVCVKVKIILVDKGLTCCICKMEQSQVFVNNKICISLI